MNGRGRRFEGPGEGLRDRPGHRLSAPAPGDRRRSARSRRVKGPHLLGRAAAPRHQGHGRRDVEVDVLASDDRRGPLPASGSGPGDRPSPPDRGSRIRAGRRSHPPPVPPSPATGGPGGRIRHFPRCSHADGSEAIAATGRPPSTPRGTQPAGSTPGLGERAPRRGHGAGPSRSWWTRRSWARPAGGTAQAASQRPRPLSRIVV